MSFILDLNRAAWEQRTYLVHSWILKLVTGPIAQTILLWENALDAWIYLKECFFKVGRICVSNLHVEINHLKHGFKFVLDYFTKICEPWEKNQFTHTYLYLYMNSSMRM